MGSNPVSPTIIFLSRADLESESKGTPPITGGRMGPPSDYDIIDLILHRTLRPDDALGLGH